MKVAISIDGDLLEEADRAARKMHLSRSRLFSAALKEYLRRPWHSEEITEQLNRVYAADPEPESSLAAKMKVRFGPTLKGRW